MEEAPENRRTPSLAGARQSRAFAGAAPAREPSQGLHPGGGGAPPGGTTASRQELADDRRARFAPPTKARPDAGVRTPQQSAERRAGPRHGPVISGDPEMDLSRGRSKGAAFRTSACRRSAPLDFFKGAETDKGIPAPLNPGGEALAD